MDKIDLKPYKATITFDKSFADYYDEAIEQLKGEGFLDIKNPLKEASSHPLWEDWNLARKEDGTWLFTATVYGISETDAQIATNVAYHSVDCAALRHLIHTEIEAISEPQNNAVIAVKHAFLYILDKETASHFMSDENNPDLEEWLYRSEFLSGYSFQESKTSCKDQGDCHIAVRESLVELYVIPKWEDIWGSIPLAQAHQFLASTKEYSDEIMLRNSLVSVEAMELVQPAHPKNLDTEVENSPNDGEFVRIILDGEPATYSYKFEVEQRFVLDHEDELKLSKAEARWWRNHGVGDAHVSDWQMWESLLIHTVRESKTFADLIK